MTTPSNAAIVVIGSGIQGLSIAYNLAKGGARNVRVVDAGYFQGGASGRNGTLIRGGFGSKEWTEFFAHSNRLWAGLSRELGENVMFTPRGYMIIAQTEATLARLSQWLPLHRANGLDAVMLTRQQITHWSMTDSDRDRHGKAVARTYDYDSASHLTESTGDAAGPDFVLKHPLPDRHSH